MHDQSSQQGGFLEDTRQGLGVLMFVARVWSISLEVFLHANVGSRYPGMCGAAVLLLVPVYSLFWEGYDLEPMLLFLLAFLLMCAAQRFTAFRNRLKKRPLEHSWYNGYPGLCELFPRLSEQAVKQVIEPVLVGFGGVLCLPWNEPFGCYLIGGSIALMVSAGASRLMRQQQVLDLNDAMIEQQQLAERFRESQHGAWR